jgi:tetratricopeptide (TPR) repeat protein
MPNKGSLNNTRILGFTALAFVIGFFVGFFLANSLNRSMINNQQAQQISNRAAGNAPIPVVIDAIERAKNEPDSFEAQFTAASMYYQIDRFEEAIKYYEAAYKLKPDDYQTIVRLGNSNYGLKRYEEARKWYEKALQINPDDVDVRTDYGTTFFLSEPKNLDKAIEEYRIALEKKPNHEPTLQNLCVVYREKGDKQALKETLAKLEKINPQNPVISMLKQEISN